MVCQLTIHFHFKIWATSFQPKEITTIRSRMNDDTSKNGLHITIVQKGGKQFMIQYLNPLRHKIEIIDVQCRLTRNHSFNAPKAIIC